MVRRINPLVSRVGTHVPAGDGSVLIEQLRDCGAGLGCLGLGRLGQQLSRLDVRQLVGFDGAGFEVLLPTGKRLGAGVHDSTDSPLGSCST
jgi:hypothetical protein